MRSKQTDIWNKEAGIRSKQTDIWNKEAGIWRKELKICLPLCKIIYSLAFVLILSLVRGVACREEIGAAMEPAMAVLAIVFCSDTYLTEVQNRRGEVFYLYDGRRKTEAMARRLALQMIYLAGISMLGYGFFVLFQKPVTLYGTSPAAVFGLFAVSAAGAAVFWGMASMTICNLWRNVWAGIGSTLVLWFFLNSQAGDRVLGKWNVFSYVFCPMEEVSGLGWLWGKLAGLGISLVLAGWIPGILKKRG